METPTFITITFDLEELNTIIQALGVAWDNSIGVYPNADDFKELENNLKTRLIAKGIDL